MELQWIYSGVTVELQWGSRHRTMGMGGLSKNEWGMSGYRGVVGQGTRVGLARVPGGWGTEVLLARVAGGGVT